MVKCPCLDKNRVALLSVLLPHALLLARDVFLRFTTGFLAATFPLVFRGVDVNRFTVTARLMSLCPSDGWVCRREMETHDPPFWFGTTPLIDCFPIGLTIKEKILNFPSSLLL